MILKIWLRIEKYKMELINVHIRFLLIGFHEVLPQFNALWGLEVGIENLIEQLEYWELNEIKFKQRDFYRLQQVEHLHRTNQLDRELNIKW